MSEELREVQNGIVELGNDTGVYVLDGGALVDFNHKVLSKETGTLKAYTSGKTKTQIAHWGENNNLPLEREALIMDNNIMPELLVSKRNLLLGQKMILFKEHYEKQTNGEYRILREPLQIPTSIEIFLEDNEIGEMLRGAAKDVVLNAQCSVEFVKKLGGDINSMKYIAARDIRAEKIKKGTIPNWFVTGDWVKDAASAEKVENYNRNVEFQSKYITRWGDNFLGGPYYFQPTWWGSRAWIQLSNVIPLFHLANLKNGYTLRYHIEFPVGYFMELTSGKPFLSYSEKEQKEMRTKEAERKEIFLKQFNDVLKGIENAGRTIHSTYEIDKRIGKEYPGIKIKSIDVDLKDKALLDLFDKSNEAVISSAGILPSLSGVSTAGKLSSGSDIRNSLSFYLATKTPEHRRILYSFVNYLGKEKGWFKGKLEGARFGSLDEVIVTTDKDSAGTEQKI